MSAASSVETPSAWCVAAAQCPAAPGAIERNLHTHHAFVAAAAQRGVQCLVFPELSLTGYEPALWATHVLHPVHPTLMALRDAARSHQMTLVVGAPAASLQSHGLPSIGAWVLQADGSIHLYRKRYLHASEATFASAGTHNALVLPQGTEAMGLSICADLTHPQHAQDARAAGATLYAASALITPQSLAAETRLLQGYAAQHGMAVLLANYSGTTGSYTSGGGSALWAPGGACVVAAPDAAPALVWARRDASGWQGGVDAVPLA